ncbi:alcohol dehydrogenase [Atractiella rhizophila]|nr:alcohol dehydrogenase [Atractiella rhizophila]
MPLSTQAVVVSSPFGSYHISQILLKEETLKPNEVLVKVIASGICHSDIVCAEQKIPWRFPTVLGHEGAGIVERVGSKVTRVKQGDKVVTTWSSCRTCRKCQQSRPALCQHWFRLNLTGERFDGGTMYEHDGKECYASLLGQGSFGRHMMVHESSCIPVPPSLSDAELAQLAPYGCGLMTGAGTILNYFKPRLGDTLAIWGMGAVGMAGLMVAKLAPYSKIIALDVVDDRLKLASELGATHVINSRTCDAVQAIRDLTGGNGVDWSMEATGIPSVVKQAYEALDKGGVLGSVGIPPAGSELKIDIWNHINDSKTFLGCVEGDCVPETFIPFLIELAQQGKFPAEKLVKTYNFSEIERAIEDMKQRRTIKPSWFGIDREREVE